MSDMIATVVAEDLIQPMGHHILTIVDVTFWSIFGLVYLILAILSFRALSISTFSAHPLALFTATICSFIQCTFRLVYITAKLGVTKINNKHERILYVFSQIAEDWALSMLFVALIQILLDNLKHITSPNQPQRKIIFVFSILFTWAGLLIVAATVVGGLALVFAMEQYAELLAVLGNQSLITSQNGDSAQMRYEIANYVLVGIWFLTGLAVFGADAYVYSLAWLADKKDKVTSLCFVGVPLYTLSILEHISFSIILPLDEILDSTENESMRDAEFAMGILSLVLRLATTIAILHIGEILRIRRIWRNKAEKYPHNQY